MAFETDDAIAKTQRQINVTPRRWPDANGVNIMGCNYLAWRRKAMGLTVAELADLACVPAAAIEQYESGFVSMPKLDTALRVCYALDTTVEKAFTKRDTSKYAL